MKTTRYVAKEREHNSLKIRYDKATIMEDIQIAYVLFVIMIGLAALSIVAFWAFKTRESDLRDFCILYALFTLVLVVMVLKKYLFLNVETYSARSWYFISGVEQVLNFAVIVATIHYFLGVSQVRSRKWITLALLLLTVICSGLILSPVGAVLDAAHKTIHFGIGFRIASGWYFASFTLLLILGYGLLRRVWRTEQRNFMIGLLIFAMVGYGETLANLPQMLRRTDVILSNENNFLFSSIPYALYGIFLISYFLQYSLATPMATDDLSEAFLSRYGITGREREIILKVIQGKSNADIASELFISLATVKTHLHNIYKKIGVESRFDLLARVRSDQ
jgi:DNA-binding CsgD family transcriptional regulator/heme/copper-type cytochrome/quinol oxidase subunit 4